MNQKDILQKIIDEDGSCCWSTPSICDICPLSKLRSREDGTHLSCIESLNADGLDEEEADRLYKKAAEHMLMSVSIHEALEQK